MNTQFALFTALAVSAVAGCATPDTDSTSAGSVDRYAAEKLATPTLAFPRRLRAANPFDTPARSPVWTVDGSIVSDFEFVDRRLARFRYRGTPVYDPSSGNWLAFANGAIVRIENDALIVVADGVQGRDVDVRERAGIAVSREPNDTIVLHRFSERGLDSTVLLAGSGFFNPRFSPDCDSILVSESRADGARIWVVSLSGSARELTFGDYPSWHPDGGRVVFVRLTDDGYSLTSSQLWSVDVVSREARLVGAVSIAAILPSVSPDGSSVAFVDGRNGDSYVSEFEDPFAKGAFSR